LQAAAIVDRVVSITTVWHPSLPLVGRRALRVCCCGVWMRAGD